MFFDWYEYWGDRDVVYVDDGELKSKYLSEEIIKRLQYYYDKADSLIIESIKKCFFDSDFVMTDGLKPFLKKEYLYFFLYLLSFSSTIELKELVKNQEVSFFENCMREAFSKLKGYWSKIIVLLEKIREKITKDTKSPTQTILGHIAQDELDYWIAADQTSILFLIELKLLDPNKFLVKCRTAKDPKKSSSPQMSATERIKIDLEKPASDSLSELVKWFSPAVKEIINRGK